MDVKMRNWYVKNGYKIFVNVTDTEHRRDYCKSTAIKSLNKKRNKVKI